jgi:hypothetical protein
MALTELLEVTYDLESSDAGPLPADEGNSDSFQALTGRLEDLQNIPRVKNGQSSNGELHPSVYAVREELAWARLESLSSAIVAMIREKRELQERQVNGHVNGNGHQSEQIEDGLPPRYSFDGQEEIDLQKGGLPDYTNDQQPPPIHQDLKAASTSTLHLERTDSAPKEKMMLELEGLTNAIDRLHLVTPRLNDQRVEMRASSSKTPMMSKELRARAEREKIRELELIWDQIERTHGKRRMRDGQRVDMADWEERRTRQVSLG